MLTYWPILVWQCALFTVHRMHPLVETAEDHLSRGSLQDAGHGDVNGLRNHLPRVVHHHHGAVVKIRHALVVFFSFLQDEDAHGLPWEYDRFQGIGQLVDVQYLDAVELGDFIEVEIVGHDFAIVDFGQLDQLHVYFADVREIVFNNLNRQLGYFLDALQHIEATPPAVALHGIGGIGHQLQLAQH